MDNAWEVYDIGIISRPVANVNISCDFLKSISYETYSYFWKDNSFIQLFVWLSFKYTLYLHVYTWLLTRYMEHDLFLCKNSTTHYVLTLPRGSRSEQTWIYSIRRCFHKSFSLFFTKIKYFWITNTLTIL